MWATLGKWIRKWGAIAAALTAMLTLLGYALHWWQNHRTCRNLLHVAQSYSDHDDFVNAILFLDKAIAPCHQNREVMRRRLEASLFKTATEYDQVKLVSDPEIVNKFERDWQLLKSEYPNDPTVLSLGGILEDLRDRPQNAVKEYYKPTADNSPNYPNVHNYWGYTILKWMDEAGSGSQRALDQFTKAAELNPKYPWPYINKAVVYLRTGNLDDAKEQLEKAEILLPSNPRVHLLWGHWWIADAERLRARRLPEADNSLWKAAEHLQKARDFNREVADVHLVLGEVYERLGRKDEAGAEYEDAAKKDAWNITACMARWAWLGKQHRAEEANHQRNLCLKLVSKLENNFRERINGTSDTDAKSWLEVRLTEYRADEKILLSKDTPGGKTRANDRHSPEEPTRCGGK